MLHQRLAYKITDKSLIHIASIERNLSILLQNEIPLKARYRILSETAFDDLYAISSFLGLTISLGDIKKIVIGRETETSEYRLIINIKQVFDFIQNNYRTQEIVFNTTFVHHIVKLLQSNIVEVWEVGKLRTTDDTPNKIYELPSQNYEQTDTTNLLADVIQWVENEKEVHPIIKATVFMMFINNTSPYVGMNFVSSLIFFRIILEKYGYGNNFSIALFKIISDKDNEFNQVLNSSLSSVNSTGLTEIITCIAEKLDILIEKHKKQLIEFDYADIKTTSDTLDLNDRQLKLLKLLQQKVYIKRREYIKLFKVAPMTAYRDLNFLVNKKLIIPTGQGKATKYNLSTM